MSNSGDSLSSASEPTDAGALKPSASVSPDDASGASSGDLSSSAESSEGEPALDYKALTRFLLEPLIDLPDDLQVSSETTAHGSKVWLRVSLGQADRGRAFGRGGRNIRAIRAVLRAAGRGVGQNVSLEVLGDGSEGGGSSRPKPKPRKPGEPRSPKPKPKPRPKS